MSDNDSIRDDMLRTLDRIVEGTVTIALREAADQRASGENAPLPDPAAYGEATRPLWTALDEAGFTAIGAGGEDDIPFADTMEMVRRAGYHALPVPLAETIAARRLLARVGIEAPAGAITLAPPGADALPVVSAGRLGGHARSVPYARSAAHLVVASGGAIHLQAIGDGVTLRGTNIAGEPRDTVDLARTETVSTAELAQAPAVLEAEGALVRAIAMAGAMSAATDHALTWVNDRVQFGRPIAKHQAVQHLMAQLAEETAAAGAASDLAIDASATAPDRFAIAVAKSRAGEAAGKGANIVHALFGAMGFTREHALHYATRRLWAWRNEFGSEVHWQAELGRIVAAKGGRALWGTLAREA